MSDPASTTAWLTLALVLITAVYALFTFRILKANEALVAEMKNQRDAEARPYVTVSVRNRTGTNLLYMSVKNTGRTAAEDLRLTLDRDYYQDGKKQEGRNIRQWTAFSETIEDLPPNVELQFLLGAGPSLLEDRPDPIIAPPTFAVHAEYSFRGMPLTETTKVDLRPFAMSSVPHDPVVEELERGRNTVREVGRDIRSAIAGLSQRPNP
jgi:hypothetical protein